jgi:hypothetical protein
VILAMVDQNILPLIRVSLKREENLARIPLASSMLSHPLLCFVSTTLVPGQRGHAYIADGGDLGTGHSHHCGVHPRHGGTRYRDFCLGGCYGAG